jgi:lactam utilization protein B
MKYMSRKKYFIPKGESVRDYHDRTDQPVISDMFMDWEYEVDGVLLVRDRNKDKITKK